MPKKILLADDSITIQKVVELTFSDGDYQVTAVNNGAKAIQKLAEMRPDIILSDIIMPEKNGYEVCEYVKSHPDYRLIPVILLTGTFEPFDPDRAEKAGCDAVVTKPFESQSLIQKVEELLAGAASQPSRPSASALPQFEEAPAEPRGWGGGQSKTRDERTPFSAPPQEEESPFAPSPSESHSASPAFHLDDPFAPAPPPPPSSQTSFTDSSRAKTESQPMPRFDPPPPPVGTGAETRAFPKMSLADLQKMKDAAVAETPRETPPPWGAPSKPAAGFPSGSTPAVPSFGTPSSFGSSPATPPADTGFGGETRAIPKLTFSEMQKMREEAAAAPPPPVRESVWAPEEPAPAAEWPASPKAEAGGGFEPVSSGAPFASAAEESPFDAPAPLESSATDWSARSLDAPSTAPSATHAGGESPSSLTEDQIERIARRVVELMSEKTIQNIAWEVIPDMAETIVRERIRELEGEK